MSNLYLPPSRLLAKLLSNVLFYALILVFPMALYAEIQPFVEQKMHALDTALATLVDQL